MKMDDFETRLSRQPLRRIPAEWRNEILREGWNAAVAGIGDAGTASLPMLNWRMALANFFWPHPKAWAGLAAVWILIFAVDLSVRDKSPVVAEKAAPPSQELVAELKDQRRWQAELIGSSQASEAVMPRYLPQPRSERVEILMT